MRVPLENLVFAVRTTILREAMVPESRLVLERESAERIRLRYDDRVFVFAAAGGAWVSCRTERPGGNVAQAFALLEDASVSFLTDFVAYPERLR